MTIPSTVASSTASAAPPPRTRLAGWWRARSPLARHIAAILLVKAVALWLLWYVCFRAPVAPKMAMDPAAVAARLAGPVPPSEMKHAVD